MGLLPLGPEPSASAIPPYPHYAIIIVVLRDFVKLCNCFLFYQFTQRKNWILLCLLKVFKTLAFLLVFFLLLSKYRFLDAI